MKRKENSTCHILVAALSLALQRRRQMLGLSQEEVARRSGLHRTYISELENQARNFSVRSFLLLAQALEVQPSELFKTAETIASGEPQSLKVAHQKESDVD